MPFMLYIWYIINIVKYKYEFINYLTVSIYYFQQLKTPANMKLFQSHHSWLQLKVMVPFSFSFLNPESTCISSHFISSCSYWCFLLWFRKIVSLLMIVNSQSTLHILSFGIKIYRMCSYSYSSILWDWPSFTVNFNNNFSVHHRISLPINLIIRLFYWQKVQAKPSKWAQWRHHKAMAR